MKIQFDKNIVTFYPENPGETSKIESLWRIMVNCNGQTLKMTPVGEYVPAKGGAEGAAFYIEGLGEDAKLDIRVAENCKVYCMTCNKLVDLKQGDPIPVCCGKIMEIID